MMKQIILLLALVLVALTGCATLTPHNKEAEVKPQPVKITALQNLQKQLDDLFNNPVYSDAFWGVEIRDVQTGELIYGHNNEKRLTPASNTKLYTTAAALYYLGPQSTFTTQVFGGQLQRRGVLDGDLIIKGTGDPTFSGRYKPGTTVTEDLLQNWIRKLQKQGVTKILGDVIGDDNELDDQYMPGSWTWGYSPSGFSAEQSALNLNDNTYDLMVIPGMKVGDPVKWELKLPTGYIQVINQATTVAAEIPNTLDYDREFNTNKVTLEGQLPLGTGTTRFWGSIHNPTMYFATVLYERITAAGIRIEGQPRDIDDFSSSESQYLYSRNTVTYLSYVSPPLSEIVRITNKYSQNYFAEQLEKVIGKKVRGIGSTSKGSEAVDMFLENQVGINLEKIHIVDGSGLSSLNRVQPAHTVQLLRYMYNNPDLKEAYWVSLPVAGVDGTLSRRIKGTPAEGIVRAKTGYIMHTRCLSGYVQTRNADTWAFSMMCGNYTVPTSRVEETQDSACVLLASFDKAVVPEPVLETEETEVKTLEKSDNNQSQPE